MKQDFLRMRSRVGKIAGGSGAIVREDAAGHDCEGPLTGLTALWRCVGDVTCRFVCLCIPSLAHQMRHLTSNAMSLHFPIPAQWRLIEVDTHSSS